MFDAKKWSEVTFFEAPDFSSFSSSQSSSSAGTSAGSPSTTSGGRSTRSSSLADTAAEADLRRRQEINESLVELFEHPGNRDPFIRLDNSLDDDDVFYSHYDPGASPQKRQKIFDYSQEGHSIATKEAPKLEDLNSPADANPFTETPSAQ